jgi:hypothetical protein
MSLSQELVKHMLDYRDGMLFWKNPNRPSKAKVGNRAGTRSNTTGYRQVSINSTTYMEHRIIFLWHHGFLPPNVDHINGDRTDNRIENLRAATVNQNRYNAKPKRNNKSGVRGVFWSKTSDKWCAAVRANNRIVFRQYFDDLELAELVVSEARRKFHGDFANHN